MNKIKPESFCMDFSFNGIPSGSLSIDERFKQSDISIYEIPVDECFHLGKKIIKSLFYSFQRKLIAFQSFANSRPVSL